mmetsp:Transcript_21420/g.64291  ORF Transcript_21420/g.64291 Transcript_21420/m.64291 type:complete len:246 (-) Transcript_21420:453-1190(-)
MTSRGGGGGGGGYGAARSSFGAYDKRRLAYLPPGPLPSIILVTLSLTLLASVYRMATVNREWHERHVLAKDLELELHLLEYLPQATLHDLRELIYDPFVKQDRLMTELESEARNEFVEQLNGYCDLVEGRMRKHMDWLKEVTGRESGGEKRFKHVMDENLEQLHRAELEDARLKRQIEQLESSQGSYKAEIDEIKRERARLADILKEERDLVREAKRPGWLGDLGQELRHKLTQEFGFRELPAPK